jgi:hypothetical protein
MLWRSHRKAFIESCVKLERIVDQTGEMTYSSHPCPASLHDLSMRLLSGTRMPAPIEAMGLKKLRLSLDHSAHLEGTGSLEAARYREKLGALLRNTKKLDKLELQLPGLPAAPPLPVEDVPPHLWTNDPLPAALRTVEVLELDVPFCTVEDGSPREAAWVRTVAVQMLSFRASNEFRSLDSLPIFDGSSIPNPSSRSWTSI